MIGTQGHEVARYPPPSDMNLRYKCHSSVVAVMTFRLAHIIRGREPAVSTARNVKGQLVSVVQMAWWYELKGL